MKHLRTLRTRSLVVFVVALVAAIGAAFAVAAGGGGPAPAPEPLDQAIHDALGATQPTGITARIELTNKLFPSGALTGQVGSALMSGASGRLWATADGRGRLELQSNAGDVQIVWNDATLTVYDASSNTAFKTRIPQHKQTSTAPASLPAIDAFLHDLGLHAAISAAQPTNVAGQPAYDVSLSPKRGGGLLASAALAWDAARGVPLRLAVYAQGGSAPVLELTATDISYGAVVASDVEVAPPSDARVVALGHGAKRPNEQSHGAGSASGLADVRAAAGFPIASPDTLAGRTRQDVRLVGGDTALAVYGNGLGAIVVVERETSAAAVPSQLGALPTVSLDGVTAHELVTPLGTALEWRRGDVSYVLAGSIPAATAETAARALR